MTKIQSKILPKSAQFETNQAANLEQLAVVREAVDFAAAACKINLRVKNETKYAIELEDGRKSFQVKTRGVPWRSVHRRGNECSNKNPLLPRA